MVDRREDSIHRQRSDISSRASVYHREIRFLHGSLWNLSSPYAKKERLLFFRMGRIGRTLARASAGTGVGVAGAINNHTVDLYLLFETPK